MAGGVNKRKDDARGEVWAVGKGKGKKEGEREGEE